MVSYKRHIAKTVTWRLLGTIDTFIISWIITGNIQLSAGIGSAEVVTKSILYYVHERAWYKLSKFGLDK